MYEDEFPTATSAQEYLNFHGWLRGKVNEMQDKWLTDFAKAWNAHATGDWDRPPQSLHNETVALSRKDAAVSVAVPGTSVVLQLDDQGNLTILGGGRAHIEVPYAAFAAGMAQLPASASIPDPVMGPPASDTPIPGASSGIMSARTPPTNQQLSMRQNELVARMLKAKRR